MAYQLHCKHHRVRITCQWEQKKDITANQRNEVVAQVHLRKVHCRFCWVLVQSVLVEAQKNGDEKSGTGLYASFSGLLFVDIIKKDSL